MWRGDTVPRVIGPDVVEPVDTHPAAPEVVVGPCRRRLLTVRAVRVGVPVAVVVVVTVPAPPPCLCAGVVHSVTVESEGPSSALPNVTHV